MKIGILPFMSDDKVSLNTAYLNFAETFSPDVRIITNADQINDIDWLWLSGGADVDPTFFGIDNYASGPVYRNMDIFQHDCVEMAIALHKHVLGICRGHQLLAYMYILPKYGDCWISQHIGGHNQSDLLNHRNDVFHSIRDRSTNEFFVNSFHHQALVSIDLKPEFTHFAMDKKNFVIEGMSFTVGKSSIQSVQWHPEELMSGLPFDIPFKQEV